MVAPLKPFLPSQHYGIEGFKRFPDQIKEVAIWWFFLRLQRTGGFMPDSTSWALNFVWLDYFCNEIFFIMKRYFWNSFYTLMKDIQ